MGPGETTSTSGTGREVYQGSQTHGTPYGWKFVVVSALPTVTSASVTVAADSRYMDSHSMETF